jgi:hypothetical protein
MPDSETSTRIRANNMAGRPAVIRQRDLKQTLIAAQKAGAKEVRVQLNDGVSVVIPLLTPDDKPVAPDEEITL